MAEDDGGRVLFVEPGEQGTHGFALGAGACVAGCPHGVETDRKSVV